MRVIFKSFPFSVSCLAVLLANFYQLTFLSFSFQIASKDWFSQIVSPNNALVKLEGVGFVLDEFEVLRTRIDYKIHRARINYRRNHKTQNP